MFGKQFIAYILKKTKDVYVEVGKTKVSINKEDFKHKGKRYFNLSEKATYFDKKNRPVVFYLDEKSAPLKFENEKSLVKAEDYETIVESRFLEKMTKGKMDKWLFAIILGLIICIAVVVMYSMYTQSSLNSQVMQLNEKLLNMTTRFNQSINGSFVELP